MGEKKWLGFVDTSEVNLPPKIEVSKSSKRLGRAEGALNFLTSIQDL
jgi:hypothetical protein